MPELSLHTIDMVIIGLYMLFVVWLGLRLGQKHDTAEDYFLAGRSMIWPFVGISLFASNISSTTLIGLAGDAYHTGISVFNYEWMATFVLVFFAIFFLPFLLRSKVYTMPEFLSKRYDNRARTYFSLLTLFLNIVVDTAASLYAGALVLKLIFPDVPLWQTILILAVVAGVYTIAGGLAAVIYTDAIQTVLLMIGAVTVTVLAVGKIGSWDAVHAVVPDDMISLIRPHGDAGVPWTGLITGVPLLGFYFWCTNQFMVQRVLSAKDLNHGRWGSLFAGLLKLPVLFVMVLPGTMAIVLYPDLPNPDLVYPTLLMDLLPVGLLGLVLAGFIAALMSQIDSTLNSASTLITMDFIAQKKPDLDNHQLMVAGRWVTFGFMLLAALWAPQIQEFGSLFKYLQKVLSYAVPPVVALFLVGIFWKRANSHGAFLTLTVGVGAGVFLFIANEIVGWVDLHFLFVAPLLFLLSVVVLVAGSLSSAPPPPEKAEDYTWSMEFYHAETRDLAGVPWYQNYRVLSVGLVILTLVIVGVYW